MSKLLYIPKVINVGYQNRKDTYTGKLAFVVYTDKDGKIRKETSWNSWCDESINKDVFENVPTSGFVLNKKVGDYRGSWDGRQAWVRIFDPRGFEFEIGVNNLLFILENCSSIKGKGLEGEFVYSWNKTELVLLPVDSLDYKESQEFTSIQANNFSAKNLVAGRVYVFKNNFKHLYLGRHNCFYHEPFDGYNCKSLGKQHVFIDLKNIDKDVFEITKNMKSISHEDSEEYHQRYAEILDKLMKSPLTGNLEKIIVKNLPKITNDDFGKDERRFLKYINGNKITSSYFEKRSDKVYRNKSYNNKDFVVSDKFVKLNYSSSYYLCESSYEVNLQDFDFVEIYAKLENGYNLKIH